MVADKVNRLFAAGAKESEIPFGGVQMERIHKSPQRLGKVRLDQALWYLSRGRNLLALMDYSDKLGKLATLNCRALSCRARSGPFNTVRCAGYGAVPSPQAG